jgi:AraC-like DNA-binding protein
MNTINTIGISILGLFVVFILTKQHKRLSDYLLVGINVLMAAYLYSDVWIKQELNAASFLFQTIISFFLSPVFIWYALVLTAKDERWNHRWWWFGIFIYIAIPFLVLDFGLWNNYDQAGIKQLFEDPPISYLFLYKGHSVFIIVCLIWLLRKMEEYAQSIKDQYSYIEPIQLEWLKRFVWVYLIINLIVLVFFLLYNFGLMKDIDAVFIVLNAAFVIANFYLSYSGIRQYSAHSFYGQAKWEKPEVILEEPKGEVKVVDEQQILFERLLYLFEDEKIFLEPQIQIQQIAEQLGVNVHKLSKTINQLAEKPFYDFVNAYRVNYLKELLKDEKKKQFTILALGLESGFNSKASLNRIFKQHTGLTPRQFQKSHLTK